MVVALRSNKSGGFLTDSPPNRLRGVETTTLLDQARRFANQAEIDAFVEERGGTPGSYVAWTLP